jgi:excisionase family DNA binding protein
MTTPVLLTVHDVAERLKVRRATVYGWIADRKLTVVRLGAKGARVRIPESEVERLIAEGTCYARGQAPVLPLAAASARLAAMNRAPRDAGAPRRGGGQGPAVPGGQGARTRCPRGQLRGSGA